jgi:hypothetical protein
MGNFTGECDEGRRCNGKNIRPVNSESIYTYNKSIYLPEFA